jgi:hypothetical protein
MHDKIAKLKEILTIVESNHRGFFTGGCKECGAAEGVPHLDGCGFTVAFEILEIMSLACPVSISWKRERCPDTGNVVYTPTVNGNGGPIKTMTVQPLVYPPLKPELSAKCPHCFVESSLDVNEFADNREQTFECPECEKTFEVTLTTTEWLQLLRAIKLEEDAAKINTELSSVYDALEGVQI